jgi:hypothetical protein
MASSVNMVDELESSFKVGKNLLGGIAHNIQRHFMADVVPYNGW